MTKNCFCFVLCRLRPERDFNKEVVGSTSRKRGRHNNNNYLLSSHTTPRHSGLMEEPIECCPSMTKAVEIRIAKTRDNKMVEVFYNESNPQVFYRTKCVEGVAGKPCLLVKDANHTSVCEQRHTYMYAIVRDYQPGNSRQDKSHDDWRLEHIRVESGCACVLVKR